MDGDAGPEHCYLMSQEGNTHKQGCYQPVRFVCRDRLPITGVLNLTKAGFEYRMFTTDATRRTSYAGALQFCQGLGAGWDLVPYWDSNGYDACLQLCAANSYTCWMKRKDTDTELCPLMAADGSRQMQGCEQDVRFVCRKPCSSG
jgi:hypothetical protein